MQPLLDLLGNVAAKRPRDLRGSDNQLCRQNIRADENELPKQDGAEGADNFTHQGFAEQFYHKLINFVQDVTYYNAYEREIAIVNIFFGEPTAYGESTCQC